ncbi:MAG: tripartite tricarboxylate transporter substrate binding protein [Spirochaetales bacterium]|nr:tripartite tricarboxylate transporter substrate binding protein [Spirochaetales bacterium]
MKNFTRIALSVLFILMAAAMVFAGGEAEEEVVAYPTQEIEAVITWGAGGLTDNIARNFLPLLEEQLGGSKIYVQNKEGASGAIGSQYVMGKPADGYTLLVTTTESCGTWNVMGISDMDVTDFQPIIMMSSLTPTCYVSADAPWNTVEELIADAKARPGKIISGFAGPGSLGHVSALLFSKYSGADFNIVPFGGGAAVVAALLGGHVDVAFNPLISVMENYKAGKVKLLATFSNEKILDEVPALGAQVPSFQPVMPYGVMVMILVHKDTPESIVNILTDAASKACADPRWKEFADKVYIEIMGQTGDEFWEVVNNWKPTTTWLLYDAGVATKSPADFGIPRN